MKILISPHRMGCKLASLLLALLAVAVSSCSNIDLGEYEYVAPSSITIGKSYEMVVGDSVTIPATVSPAEVSVSDIFWESEDPSLVVVRNGVAKAVGVGQTRVIATTIDGSLGDTCTVVTYERTEEPSYERLPYDMVLYVSVRDAEENDVSSDYIVSAWCGDEARGLGKAYSHLGYPYMVLRVYSEQPEGDEIVVNVRGRRDAVNYTFPHTFIFNSDTYGSPSVPIVITLP